MYPHQGCAPWRFGVWRDFNLLARQNAIIYSTPLMIEIFLNKLEPAALKKEKIWLLGLQNF